MHWNRPLSHSGPPSTPPTLLQNNGQRMACRARTPIGKIELLVRLLTDYITAAEWPPGAKSFSLGVLVALVLQYYLY